MRTDLGGEEGGATSAETTVLATGSARWVGVGLGGGSTTDGTEDSLAAAEAVAVTTAGLRTIQEPTPSPATSRTPSATHGARR